MVMAAMVVGSPARQTGRTATPLAPVGRRPGGYRRKAWVSQLSGSPSIILHPRYHFHPQGAHRLQDRGRLSRTEPAPQAPWPDRSSDHSPALPRQAAALLRSGIAQQRIALYSSSSHQGGARLFTTDRSQSSSSHLKEEKTGRPLTTSRNPSWPWLRANSSQREYFPR